ncbi:amino acid--[acyl-carrier-protein] ligase [Caballeronia sp. LZ062]|uniref:amino acid--[acyl-carrier-protein] ligase n=1 Tax=unclassified Caballeronia TaxID=2646786 RepID=UPI00285D4F49|nr:MULTISPECIES: amino acid--[acyl-carrier-protein] ligase [unclassified Caballeronia]MDR5856006.1 amino acid--[acyl-carrier-protein] ligase [Caballeronia sp. LZ050]MDR5872676.1 amino acid--[acyl-carrier-protein] ligase [Caballeronia sp. LZ062]
MNMPTEQAALVPADAPVQSQSNATQTPYDKSDVTLRDRLIEAGILIDTGEDGLYGRSAIFEDIVERLNQAITLLGADQHAEVLRFPPAMRRRDFEDSEYLKSFPNLAGTVHSFQGSDRGHHRLLEALDKIVHIGEEDERSDEWMDQQKPTRLVLTPAACYPIYPLVAKRGNLAKDGATFDAFSYCFRHEPSIDPGRMQMFRMREYIRVGSPEQVMAFRQKWIERGSLLVNLLQLPFEIDLANDPFFGRGGKIVADSQRAQELKFELLVPVATPDRPTACLSFNYHMEHFGELWHIRQADDSVAHTACVGFGMERTTLALFRHHGLDVKAWPSAVRELLWGDAAPMIADGLAKLGKEA